MYVLIVKSLKGLRRHEAETYFLVNLSWEAEDEEGWIFEVNNTSAKYLNHITKYANDTTLIKLNPMKAEVPSEVNSLIFGEF